MPKSLIEAHNIYKSYHQGDVEIKVLKNFSMQLLEGDFLAITGQSGSGKTTLLNILGLIDNFDSGSLNYLGNSVLNMSEIDKDKTRKANLGFVYQSNNLYNYFLNFYIYTCNNLSFICCFKIRNKRNTKECLNH